MIKERSIYSRIIGIMAGIVYIVVGFLMIQNPNTTLATLSLFMGWMVTISGLAAVAYALKFKSDLSVHSTSLLDGILLLLLGLMFLFGDFIHNTMLLAYLLVFWIIIDSAAQLQYISLLPKGGLKNLIMVMDALIILYGLYMLFNPQAAENFLVFYLGFAFLSTGINKFFKSI